MLNGLTQKGLKDVAFYDQDTGIFTRIKNVARGSRIGGTAGTTKRSGYCYICINRVNYLAHRLAWLYTYGEWPTLTIDHINRVRNDNRIINLRLATQAQQAANATPILRSKHGLRGVLFDPKANTWRALRPRTTHYFGSYETKEQASAVYENAKLIENTKLLGGILSSCHGGL